DVADDVLELALELLELAVELARGRARGRPPEIAWAGAGPPRLEARGAEAVFALGFGRLDRLLPERRGRRGRRVVDKAGRAVGFTPEAALRGLADLAREAEGQLEKDGADELVQGDHAEEHRREDAARLAEVATDDRG